MKIETIALPQRKVHIVRVLTALSKPNISNSETNRLVAIKMIETFQIAFLATTISALLASLLTFISARPSSIWGRVFNYILQPILAVVRAVHPLITCMFIILLAGIGSKSGVLALTVYSTAVLIGEFSEYAQGHMSLNWPLLFKVFFPGLTFKYLSVNFLIASVLGLIGGGGIGLSLIQSILLLDYHNAGTAILACIIAIGGLHLISRAVWFRVQKYNLPELIEHA